MLARLSLDGFATCHCISFMFLNIEHMATSSYVSDLCLTQKNDTNTAVFLLHSKVSGNMGYREG